MSELVSIIIPCFNVEDCIERAVHSAFSQKYAQIEVICVDNNSTDKTAAILQDLKVKFPDLILSNETNQGAPATRNKGLSLSKGKWIQFLDADDEIDSEKIKYQVSFAMNADDPDQVLVVGQKKWNRADGSTVINKLSEDKWKDLIHGRLGDTCANLWSREALVKVGGWNEKKGSSQEIDLQFRLLKNNVQVIYDQEPHTIIYEREVGSITRMNPEANFIRVIESRMEIRNYLLKNRALENYIPFTDYFIFNNLKNIYTLNPHKFSELFDDIKKDGYNIQNAFQFMSTKAKLIIRAFGLKLYLQMSKTD